MKFYLQKLGGDQDVIHQYQLWFESDSQAWNAMEGTLVFDTEGLLNVHTGPSALKEWLSPVHVSNEAVHFQGFTLNGVPLAHRHLILEWTQDAKTPMKSISLNNYRVLKHDGLGSILKKGSQDFLFIEKSHAFQEAIYYDENQELQPFYLVEHYELIDSKAPEAFYPFIQKSDQGEDYFIYKSFDTGSGISKYRIIFEDESFIDKENAGIYWLKSQEKSPIKVWTYDHAGNIQKERIFYPSDWITPHIPAFSPVYFGLGLLGIFFILIEFLRRRLQ